VSEWKPIEDADDSGVRLMLYVPGELGVTVGYLWRGEKWIDCLNDDREVEPTHWQRLPGPPSTEPVA
jgi:hypothetical protein